MQSKILNLLARKDYAPATLEELFRRLRLPANQRAELQRTLRALEQNGQIIRTKGKRYIKTREADLVSGVIRINRQGKGFLRPDDRRMPEIVIPESATGTALHGDRVLVRVDVAPRGLGRAPAPEPTGAVVRILERKRKIIAGTLQRSRQFLYVIPDDPRLPHDIYVPPPHGPAQRASVGDKVVVRLREWTSRHTNPEGEIIEVLGPPDQPGVDLLSVIRQYQLPQHFPKAVLDQATAIAGRPGRAEPKPQEYQGRVDCRAGTVITIDPEDAKDFDDAISLESSPRGGWRLWVHIADVSHYVQPGTTLDQEARKRGNSTYLVDRVVPMLPELLSNELCSLQPEVDRLTKCVEFQLAGDGRLMETKFYPAVIRSRRRFNYREVMGILERPPADAIERMLHQAHGLAQHLRRARFKGGALDLDFTETRIVLDDRGRIARIDKVESDASHQLIEEFMLLANEAVAIRLEQRHRPGIYRVHESPDERRLQEYRQEVLRHGIPCGDLRHRPEAQRLLHRLNASPIGPALKIGFLRVLRRARYDIQPLGHYGLNKRNYAHFTSPIRRYADLVVHRALFEAHHGPADGLAPVADHISETERNSADAERDSKEVKLFAFLQEQLRTGKRQQYPALVSDVRNFGFFVDVPDLGLGGLVHLSTIKDDVYILDAARAQLIGRRTRRVIKLGDRVLVQVQKVDTFKKQADFTLVKVGREIAPGRPLRPRLLEERRAHPPWA